MASQNLQQFMDATSLLRHSTTIKGIDSISFAITIPPIFGYISINRKNPLICMQKQLVCFKNYERILIRKAF